MNDKLMWLPGLHACVPAATYFLRLDFSGMGLGQDVKAVWKIREVAL